jgi:hypothetical protein
VPPELLEPVLEPEVPPALLPVEPPLLDPAPLGRLLLRSLLESLEAPPLAPLDPAELPELDPPLEEPPRPNCSHAAVERASIAAVMETPRIFATMVYSYESGGSGNREDPRCNRGAMSGTNRPEKTLAATRCPGSRPV